MRQLSPNDRDAAPGRATACIAALLREELDRFGEDHFDAWGNIEDPDFQEPPMTPDRADADSPYLAKVLAAGSYKAYEKAHLKRLVDMFLPKFPDLPAEIIPNIVRHWGHVGYY
jgi:hypothetical protein